MGFLFPTLLQLQHTYEQLSHSTSLKYCAALASAILVDINTRFSPYFTLADGTQSAALASITHPAFKLRWIKPANVEHMKNLFLNTLRFSTERKHQKNTTMLSRTDEVVDSKTLDFFTFMVDPNGDSRATLYSQAELQGLQYLEDSDRALSVQDHWSGVCSESLMLDFLHPLQFNGCSALEG